MNDLFAKHRRSTEIIKQYGRNRKTAKATLTSVTMKKEKKTNRQANKRISTQAQN